LNPDLIEFGTPGAGDVVLHTIAVAVNVPPEVHDPNRLLVIDDVARLDNSSRRASWSKVRCASSLIASSSALQYFMSLNPT
jgi:hypothetical protein